jgi:hypothetical protein
LKRLRFFLRHRPRLHAPVATPATGKRASPSDLAPHAEARDDISHMVRGDANMSEQPQPHRMQQTMPEDGGGWHQVKAGPHLHVYVPPQPAIARPGAGRHRAAVDRRDRHSALRATGADLRWLHAHVWYGQTGSAIPRGHRGAVTQRSIAASGA